MQKTLTPAATSVECQEFGEDKEPHKVREAENEQGETAATQNKIES